MAIRHSVAFALRHAPGSAEETSFLDAGAALASIPGVESFKILREVSAKNDFRFAFAMDFADQTTYDAYNSHPDHVAFVEQRWVPEVTSFVEIDTVSL